MAREAIFISHASPEDNPFARWLGAKLAAMGYEVWADVLNLEGGHDWAREMEDALRHRAIKMLLACSPLSMSRDGVRAEIEIASQVARTIGDKNFIIPLRLDRYEAAFRVATAQYIDFSNGWSSGLTELLELITGNSAIPRKSHRPLEPWLAGQAKGATKLLTRNERLSSNWLEFVRLPRTLYHCEPPRGFPIEDFQNRLAHDWPIVPFGLGALTFEKPSAEGFLGGKVPARLRGEKSFPAALHEGWPELGISNHDVRVFFSDLGNQAFDRAAKSKKLKQYASASGRLSWWPDIKTAPKSKVSFKWPDQTGRRKIIGVSGKRGVHWHYGVNASVRASPIAHMRISARLVFSLNGLDALEDVKRNHRLRRSLAKSWRNPRWRDMLMAFLWWFADGSERLAIPVSQDDFMLLALPPMAFSAPVAVHHHGAPPPDDDDPDLNENDLGDADDDDAE